MDIRSAIGSVRAASEPRTIARESASPDTANSISTTASSDSRQTAAAEAVRTTTSGQFFVSPFLTFDSRSLTVIFQIRDTESGDVERQFPAESVVERYRRDPSARPFVLPEPDTGSEEEAGPPPPTIGGPVTQALRDAEAAEAAASSGNTSPDTQTTAGTTGRDTASAQPAASPAPSSSPAGRGTIDLVA